MSANTLHHDWLALIEISGPFLAVPVLTEAFPQGLEELNGIRRKRLRQAYEEWREAQETDDPQFGELHIAWINEVLSRCLELDEDGKGDVLKRADWCTANLSVSLHEYGVTLVPDLAVIDEQRGNRPLMLIHTHGNDVDLDATLKLDGWAATPTERMVQLCRATGCRLGLVTNGERWMLVDAPVGAVTTFASWYARIWVQEPITLQAFVHLLGIRRFFVDEAEQLPALFDRSLKYQDEVTDALGEQVRRAVEVLIQSLDKADQDRDRELLCDVKEPELYEAALTVMMRLVFLLSAEERGLLLLGDERYEANYALSTLRMQLRKESEEILERRWDAWSRLLAIFRAVFGGIEHVNLRLPALGGSLFDPDRFPFLEGRAKGSNWRTDTAKPLPIDNRTVLLLLEAIQQFQGRTLSYRALDVEQIGYVYEGLLERTVKRTSEVTLELDGTKSAKSPWVKLAELESARLEGANRLAELLQERSGSSVSRVRNDLAKPVDDTLADRLLAACHGDAGLRDRIKPFAHLVRTDPWGYPLIYPTGAFIVTTGSDRRETGTHYTPKSLTETIVTETLTPIAYMGPADGTPREQWVLKSPAELLDLKICDPAMGSGAFLVQACRWLADRLVEAWSLAEASDKSVSVDGEVLDSSDTKEPLPRDIEARTVIARRLIAERCLYGVDLNPLAVELAKLSIWLVTLAKGRPFGFLDHNMRCGDSLLGIHRLDQLTQLSMIPTGHAQLHLFGQNIEGAVREAIALRQQLREMPIHDIRDVEAMAHLDADARRRLEVPECIADAFIGEVFASGGTSASLAIQAGQAIDGDLDVLLSMRLGAVTALSTDLPADKPARRPFHWPLEFPEVFLNKDPGFSAVIGNPPFAEGEAISRQMISYIKNNLDIADCSGNNAPSKSTKINLLTSFIERFLSVARLGGQVGFVFPNPLLKNERYWRARQYLLENSQINIIFNFHSDAFRSASVETGAIVARKDSGEIACDTFLIDCRSMEMRSEINIDEAVRDKYFVIRTEATSNSSKILETIEKGKVDLDLYFDSRDGINPGRKDFRGYFLGQKVGDNFVAKFSVDKDHWLSQPETFNESIHKKTINGRNFSEYSRIDWDGTYLRYADSFAYLEEFFVKGTRWSAQLRERGHFDREIKVVSRQTANSLIATIDDEQYFPLNTVHVHFPKVEAAAHGYNCYVLCGILNSKLMRFYYRIKSQETGSVFPQVHLSKLRRLPIPAHIEEGVSLEIEHLVKLAIRSGHLGDNLAQIDRLVYSLFNVSANDILEIEGAVNDAASINDPLSSDHVNEKVYSKQSTHTSTVVTPDAKDVHQAIAHFLVGQGGWQAKADVLAATGITDGQWNAAIAALTSDGYVERQGERRGARYRFVKGRQ